MKPSKSPYSKMYLVTPGVYNKLLTCLDEKEKKSTELLNVEKEREDRPGEKVIEDITTGDFEPPEVEDIPQVEEQQQVEEQPQAEVQPMVEDIVPPTPEVFGGVETEVQPQQIVEEGEIIEQMQVPPGEPDIPEQQQQQQINPLRTPCAIPTDPNQVVKQPAFNPVGVRGVKRTSKLVPKVIKQPRILRPTLLVKNKPVLYSPQIIRQPQQQIVAPQIVRAQQEEQIQPDIAMPSASTSSQVSFKSPKKAITCPICKKVFPRPWNLARHVGTVHKNLGSVKDILENKVAAPVVVQQPIQQQTPIQNKPVVPQPRGGFKYNRDIDEPMGENQQFENWIKPGKRKSTEAKLLTKPPIRRIKRGHVQKTPQDEQDKYEFESWN
jgi:hypothetical protein